MREKRKVRIIDTHTEGEPTRVLIREKMPEGCINASSARQNFNKYESKLKTAILQEPRGHRDQFGSVVYPSNDGRTDFTIFFTTTTGYLDMCAHATIGTTTALVHEGLIDASEAEREIKYNTPAGDVSVSVRIKDGEAESVTLKNVPSFTLGRKTVKAGRPVNGDIALELAFGGNFYAIVSEDDIGVRVQKENISELRKAGAEISRAVFEQIHPVHPDNPEISPHPLTMITGKPMLDPGNYRNIVIFPSGSFDRSPCGTGTSARSSVLFKNRNLSIGDTFIHESITGTTFKCRIAEEVSVGGYDAVVPEITGSAWVTQISEIIIDSTDPLRDGFLIG